MRHQGFRKTLFLFDFLLSAWEKSWFSKRILSLVNHLILVKSRLLDTLLQLMITKLAHWIANIYINVSCFESTFYLIIFFEFFSHSRLLVIELLLGLFQQLLLLLLLLSIWRSVISILCYNRLRPTNLWMLSGLRAIVSFEVFACPDFGANRCLILIEIVIFDTFDADNHSHWTLLRCINPQRTVASFHTLDWSPFFMELESLFRLLYCSCKQFWVFSRCAFNNAPSLFLQAFSLNFVRLHPLLHKHISLKRLSIGWTHIVQPSLQSLCHTFSRFFHLLINRWSFLTTCIVQFFKNLVYSPAGRWLFHDVQIIKVRGKMVRHTIFATIVTFIDSAILCS